MKQLTREDVIKGVDTRETIDIPELDGSVTVRPVTESEAADIRSVALEGLSTQTIQSLPKLKQRIASADAMDIDDIGLTAEDLIQAQKNDSRGNTMAAAFGLSCDGEEWTPEDVGRFPVNVVERIAKVVFDISGMSREGQAQARKFRADRGSAGTDGAPQDGLQAGNGHPEPDTDAKPCNA